MSALQLQAQSDTRVVSGVVLDSMTKQPVAGLAIRAKGASIGTYSKRDGRFYLPVPVNTFQLQVRGMGYRQRSFDLSAEITDVRISVVPEILNLPSVTADGEITAEEVIKRAIARKEENAARVRSLENKLYSKIRVGVDAGGLSKKEGRQDIITETFSTITEQRIPVKKKHTRITQRRQTANLPAEDNLAVFDEFFDFTEDENNVLNTRLITPLGRKALEEYQFAIVRKVLLDNLWVYEISFAPKSRLFPGYEGTLSIYEHSYQVVAAKFAPSQETAFPYLKGFTIEQKYDRVQDSIWLPTYQQAAAQLRVKLMPFVELTADVLAQTNVTDVRVNIPISDSLFPVIDPDTITVVQARKGEARVRVRNEGRQRLVVDSTADSATAEFWDSHSFSEQTDEERAIYIRQDSIKKNSPPEPDNESRGPLSGSIFNIGSIGDFAFGLDPYLNRSPVTGTMYGAALTIAAPRTKLSASAAWGRQSTRVGRVDLDVNLFRNRGYRVNVLGSAFSSLASVQDAKNSQLGFNSIDVTNLFYAEYSDFYRRDGFDAGLRLRAPWGITTLGGSWARNINMPLVEQLNRPQAMALPGNYRVLAIRSQILGSQSPFASLFAGANDDPISGNIHALYGTELASGLNFWSIDANVTAHIPTIRTGYTPMMLDVTLEGGRQAIEAPQQFRFVTMRTFPLLGRTNQFATIGINRFAGTEYVTMHAEHNFSDLWWRALGLPGLLFGRGVDLIGRFSATTVKQGATPVVPGQYFDSTKGYYMEAGFAVSRIPSYYSELIFFRVDARWPVGPLASQGSFGWIITLTSPF